MKKSNTNEFILRARTIHGWKYDYSKVEYVNSYTKICIICPEHGEFWQTPTMHLKGQGCKKCYGNYKSSTTEFVKKSRKIHGDKYDYSKVVYENNHKKVCIICPIHGEFWQKPNAHLLGNGCKKCSYEISPRRKRKTLEEFIKDANEKHNFLYDYSKVVYSNNKTPVCIICHVKDKYGKEHGEFWQRPDNHLHGQVCPKCAKKISKLEKNIIDFLTKNNIVFIHEKKFEWLNNQRLDFYLPKYNIAIECQGEQHFMPVIFGNYSKEEAEKKLIINNQKDTLKQQLCEKNGVKIIYYTTKELNKKFNKNYITNLKQLNKTLKKYE